MRALTTHPRTTHTHARAANVELGQMVQMSSVFYLFANSLSSAIPTGECMRAHELHELSAAAHHTHNRKRPITERPPARCVRSPLILTQLIHTHARPMQSSVR